MIYTLTLMFILHVTIVTIPVLLIVAYVTLAEREHSIVIKIILSLMDYYIHFRNIIKNNLLFVSFVSMFIVSFFSLVAVIFYTRDTYIYVLAIYTSLGVILYIFKYRPSLLHNEYIVNRITTNIILYGLFCLLGLLYLIFYDYSSLDFISNSNFQLIRLGVLSCACVFFFINFIYMPWRKEDILYLKYLMQFLLYILQVYVVFYLLFSLLL
jgi:hypothetical protein